MKGKSKSAVLSSGCKIFMLCVFLFIVILPILRMFISINGENLSAVLSSPEFLSGAWNSLLSSLAATAISITVAYFAAFFIERSAIKCKAVFSVIMMLPMLIPSISHGMGLIILFGNNGIITNLLGLTSNIYGFFGIITGSVLYSFPVAFLMFSDVMRYQDYSPYEAAKILGISPWRRFVSITLPYLRRPLISIIFAVFTMIITDYGVPLMVGGKFKTISVIMYQEVIGQLNFERGSVYGAVLMIPAVIAFIVDLANKDKGNMSFVSHKFEPSKTPAVKTLGYLYCGIVCILTLLPLLSFAVLGFTEKYPNNLNFSLKNIASVISLSGDRYLLNSIIIAVCTAIFGTAIGFITAYLTSRMNGVMSKALHLIAITAMAVPGIVLGLSYVISFKGTAIYGTLFILILANTVHFIASPYLMMYNSLSKLNENIESVGETLGIGRLRLIKDVFLPQSLSTLAEMFTYFFVNSMMTISAVSFLARTATKPVALMINQFEAQMQLENAAIVSIAILLINVIMKIVIAALKKFFSRKSSQNTKVNAAA